MRHVLTPRLLLDAVVADDLEAHHALLSDPDVWRHLPSGVYADRARTAARISEDQEQWARTGLGYWTARLRDDLPGTSLTAGAVVGTGGCAVRAGTDWWNLAYRFTPAAWGHGLAAELVTAALDAARAVDPELPVIAYLLEHNAESKGRAERSGLTLVWHGPDAHNPDPDAVRLVYADRAVDDELLARVTALG